MFIKSISSANLNNLDKKRKATTFSGVENSSYMTLNNLDKKRKFSETTLNNLDNLDKKRKLF